jgi:hypothetical protein
VLLLQALDAAIRRHDPHALDALLMQFAAVIVSTTGAEVDRMEREIMVRAAGLPVWGSLQGYRLMVQGCMWLFDQVVRTLAGTKWQRHVAAVGPCLLRF